MYEGEILKLLSASGNPFSIGEVRGVLAKKLGKVVSYETVKRDLMSLAAKGEICSKSIGRGRRVSWIFWLPKRLMPEARKPPSLADPFGISIVERDSMNPKQFSELYDRVLEECGSMVKQRMKEGSRFLILYDKRIVFSSDHEISDEDVRELEQKHGKVCYIVTEDLIEESFFIHILPLLSILSCLARKRIYAARPNHDALSHGFHILPTLENRA